MSMTTTEPTPRAQTPQKNARAAQAPLVDVFENKEHILILADLPGVTSAGLTVSLDGDQLTIEARREGKRAEVACDYRRVFVVPRGLDADRIAANLQGGVLRLVLPKPDALKPRQIPVKAG